MMPLKDLEARRTYHRNYMRRKFRDDPVFKAKHTKRVRANDKRYGRKRAALVKFFRSAGCLLCSEKEHCCLTAHHVKPALKEFEISNGSSGKMSPTRLAAELKKCICLCMNCHAKVHAKVLKVPRGTLSLPRSSTG